jgi:hypothetical protein
MPSASSKPNFCAGATPSDVATLLRTLTFASEVRATVARGQLVHRAPKLARPRHLTRRGADGDDCPDPWPSQKHAFQVRKDPARTPYINHPSEPSRSVWLQAGCAVALRGLTGSLSSPVAVANFIAETGETDMVTLQAALLHDTVEDTDCSIAEIAGLFGPAVAGVVDECTDEAGVSSFRSKQAQIKTCPGKSQRARKSGPLDPRIS